jgi:hypothetical protein
MSKKFPKLDLKLLDTRMVLLRETLRAGRWYPALKLAVAVVITSMLTFVLAGSVIESTSIFTISLLPASKEGAAEISLSETADFASPTTVLGAQGIDNMTNISESWLPDDLDETDGVHNGENYIAYTFYVRNVGEQACTLTEQINLDSAVLGADAAVRVRMYRNGVPTTYAKIGADGLPEYATTPFESEEVISYNEHPDFKPGDTLKYTLVIWLEGDDPECLDNIKGGNVKMSMTFTVQEQEPQP